MVFLYYNETYFMEKTRKKTLCIIPARGGSKGIPRKNIKEFAGKPLIAWTIESAKAAGVFDRIIVSTDDKEISEIAQHYEADVPFLRPSELAQDDTPTISVIVHAVQWLEENQEDSFECIVLLEPTFPLRTPQHIKEALSLFNEGDADSVVSVVPVPGHFNPHWQFTINSDQRLTVFTGEDFRDIIPRRQALPTTYTRNGAMYVFKADLLSEDVPNMYGNKVLAYVMEEKYCADIDTQEDWNRTEEKRIHHGL